MEISKLAEDPMSEMVLFSYGNHVRKIRLKVWLIKNNVIYINLHKNLMCLFLRNRKLSFSGWAKHLLIYRHRLRSCTEPTLAFKTKLNIFIDD